MTALMTRSEFVGTILHELRSTGGVVAVQGSRGALDDWCRSTGPADLDLWTRADNAEQVASVLHRFGGRQIAATRDAEWLQHDQYVCALEGGPAVVDVTVGDIRVGSIQLCAENDVTVNDLGEWNRLSGWAAVTDLALRPLLRGRQPSEERFINAQEVWMSLDDSECIRAINNLSQQVGNSLARRICKWLNGGPPLSWHHVKHLRVRLATASLATRQSRRAAWNHRIELVRGLPVLQRRKGTLVVMLGTDGAGKTATSASLAERLRTLDIPTHVRYFGRGRGNLPGLAHVRRLLDSRDIQRAEEGTTERRGPSFTKSALRRTAAWYYLLEYPLRYWILVHPRIIRGDTMILDRYVHDLWIMDPPTPVAARLASLMVPLPDVLIHLDPPLDVILQRKQERTAATAEYQQSVYRRLLRERPASRMTISITAPLPLEELCEETSGLVVPIIFRRRIDRQVQRRRFPSPTTIPRQ